MSKIGKFWLFGKQDEPAEDYDSDYDGIYYADSSASTATDDSVSAVAEKNSVIDDGYNSAYGVDVDVKVVDEDDETEEVEEIDEPLYKVVFAPDTYRDSAEIVDSFKIGRVCVIDTADLPREDFIRMLDYVMGAIQALDGELVRIDRNVVALFPADVDTDIDVDEIEDEPEDYYADDEDGEGSEE